MPTLKRRNQLNSDYLYIRAFARFMKFREKSQFVANQLRRARRISASQDVIFHSDKTGWQTIGDIRNKVDRAIIRRFVIEQEYKLKHRRG